MQRVLRQIKDKWFNKKVENILSCADHKYMKKFHSSPKAAYGPQSSGSMPVFSTVRNSLITDENIFPECWSEEFDSILSCPITNKTSTRSQWLSHWDDILLWSGESCQTHIYSDTIYKCQSPGSDSMPAEIYTAGNSQLFAKWVIVVSDKVEAGDIPYSSRWSSSFMIAHRPADGNTRSQWSTLSSKSVSKYPHASAWCFQQS